MKFEKLKPGMVVYDVHREKMGNTTLSTVGTWTVRIVSVDADTRSCMASWNTNPPTRHYEHTIRKWRENKPLMIRTTFGSYRLATREEIAAHKAKQADA
jgi:hypothetical protein